MLRSRTTQSTLIGCLAALASFCALNALAGDNYSIVAQSTRSSAATGRRPLAERITAANLPIIAQSTGAVTAARTDEPLPQENIAVAPVRVEEMDAAVTPPAPSSTASRLQATAKAWWRAATGSRSDTVTR